MSSTHILKFMNQHNQNQEKYFSKKSYSKKNIFSQSDSYIYSTPALHKNNSNPFLCSSLNNNSNYVTKKLPPIEIYNVVNDEYQQIPRPEYIVRQKPTYPINYSKSLEKGYKKVQGQFQAYMEILNRNSTILKPLTNNPGPPVNQLRKSSETQSTGNLPSIKYVQSHTVPPKKKKIIMLEPIDQEEIKRSNYLAHNNVFDNNLQHEIDKEIIKKKLVQRKMVRQSLGKNDSTYRKIRLNQKLFKKDYEINEIEDEKLNLDELSDVLGKCNDIDEEDENQLLSQLTHFDKMVEEIHEFKSMEDKKKKS